MKGSAELLSEWQQKQKRYMEAFRDRIKELEKARSWKVISYFTYSVHLAHDRSKESILLGSYHIHNIGEEPFVDPYICLQLSEDSPFQFSGKYLYKDSIQKLQMSGAWERLNEADNKTEYWLRPSGKQLISPGEKLTFSNFQMKWIADKKYAGSLNGYTYGEEAKEGIPSLNQINLSGEGDAGG
ncbi:hypothetical protein QRD89_08140 [Halobacillus sp. ACCC02827]|uniref:hypothetical protein n=1 Tax=Bacillaceae TaxID=186817 RepID=UPI0002A4D195|nr:MULTISPECIES: hypothetical protein [Bacillaceae]ELK44976.1 hypothetical protein D479_16454 [Halobacillus sp. BAB-2008]QHT46491.1 hypothetical protein M662_08310 [Bacillus sp. SB49]WJE17304.1 hypothetical protein QRD89_08140 [Halobacillus sp. ACCC02827]